MIRMQHGQRWSYTLLYIIYVQNIVCISIHNVKYYVYMNIQQQCRLIEASIPSSVHILSKVTAGSCIDTIALPDSYFWRSRWSWHIIAVAITFWHFQMMAAHHHDPTLLETNLLDGFFLVDGCLMGLSMMIWSPGSCNFANNVSSNFLLVESLRSRFCVQLKHWNHMKPNRNISGWW